jgi:hypothetical protein
MAECRSCGAPIIWALTEQLKRIPMNPDPVVPPGLFVLDEVVGSGKPPTAISLARATGPSGPRLYESHFATCPDAAKHRRPAG